MKETDLLELKGRLVELREQFGHTVDELADSNEQFEVLVKSMLSLGKCAEEFEDQQLQTGEEGEGEAAAEEQPAGLGFGGLRRMFNYSGERFEMLTLKFSELVKNAESGLADVVEVIGAVDSFSKGREETIRQLWTDQGGDPDDRDGMEAFYVSTLGAFVDNLQRFLEQSEEGFVRVLGESSREFEERISELVERSEQH